MNYIQENQSNYTVPEIVNNGYFLVDYQCLILNDTFLSQWENFKEHLLSNSEYCLQCLGLGMHQFIVDFYENKATEESENVDDLKLKVIHPRIINFEPVLNLKDIRVSYYGR